jgi:hypothetical protein
LEGNNNGAKNVPNRFGLMASNKKVFHWAEKQNQSSIAALMISTRRIL